MLQSDLLRNVQSARQRLGSWRVLYLKAINPSMLLVQLLSHFCERGQPF